jgi:hypothetical protein
MVRQEAGPRERQPKNFKGELENKYWNLENWHSDDPKKVQLTFSQGKKKKGDEVEDEDDDDVMRTSVSQGRVTVTLCTEKLFLYTQYT